MTEFSAQEVSQWLDSMQNDLQALSDASDPFLMIGIRTGGVDVGRHLHTCPECQRTTRGT